MALRLVLPPAQDPVTVNEMKEYLRVDGNEFDTTVANLIKAAREAAQDYQNRAFYTQTLELSFDRFPVMPVKIPRPPMQNLVSVKYTNADGIETAMDQNDFIVDKRSEPGRVTFKAGKTWPSVQLQPIDSVVIQFTAGHNDINKVPSTVKLAYMVFITHRYENPGSEDIPQAFYTLLGSDRMVPV